nr:ABC transporter substrate-binding protein [Bacillota bacterium]
MGRILWKRRRSVLAVLLAVAMASLLLAGCTEQVLLEWRRRTAGGDGGPPAAGGGTPGGVWVESIAHPPRTLDPALAVTRVEGRVASLMFSGLLALSPDGSVVPDLAEEWRVLEGGRVYEFRLREGLTFHDGTPLVAADVERSFRRLLDPALGSPRAWVLSGLAGAEAFAEGLTDRLEGVEVLSDRDLRITLARPFVQFPYLLTMPAAAVVREPDQAAGRDYPLGAGPFRLAGRDEDGSLRLEAFPGYHAGPPYLDGVHLRVLPEPQAALETFADRGLHVVDLLPDAARHLTDEVGWTGPVERVDLPAVYYLALNNQAEPLNDPLVRRALNHAIDRQAILDEVLPGGYVLANGSIPPGLAGHDPEAPGFAYDPDLARRLLEQAGLGGGFEMDLVQTGSPLVMAINERIADMLGEVGVRVNIRTLAVDDFYAAAGRDGDADAFLISWWGDYPDAENFLYPLFHSRYWGAGGNRARFASPDVDQMLEQLRTTADDATRASLYRQAERQIFERAPWVPLFFPVRYRAVQADVRDYVPSGFYHARDLRPVWLEQPAN